MLTSKDGSRSVGAHAHRCQNPPWEWRAQLGIDEPIESYPRPYAAIATDLATGREIWLQSGPIHEAVRASIALPGALSPGQQ